MAYSDPADQKAYARRHYEANRETYAARAAAHRKAARIALRAYIRDAKTGKPCADCAVAYPHYVMQFDHREGTKKLFDIGVYVRNNSSLARLQAEIAKCDLVCSNCHAERTYSRGQRFAKRPAAPAEVENTLF